MGGSATWAAQEAVYSILLADSTFNVLLGGTLIAPRVFDGVDDNQDFPYAAFGRISEVPNDTFGGTLKQVSLTLRIFSRYQGNKEAAQAADRAAYLLDGAALSITGYTNIRCTHKRTEVGLVEQGGLDRVAEVDVLIDAKQA